MDTESKCNFATIAELCQSGDKEKKARESWFGSPCKTEDCNSTTNVKEKQPHGDESLNSSQGECPICAAFFSLNNIEAHVEECIVASEAKEIRETNRASSKQKALPRSAPIGSPQSLGLARLLSNAAPNKVADTPRNIKSEYKRIQRTVLSGTLPCTKREAVQIAAVHLLLDTLREDKNKKQKTATTDDPSKFLKFPVCKYFAVHWTKKLDPEILLHETWSEVEKYKKEMEVIFKAEDSNYEKKKSFLMSKYVSLCYALPFFGMTLYHVMEFKDKERKIKFTHKADKTNVIKRDGMENDNSNKAGHERESSKGDQKKSSKVKHEKVPIKIGISKDCSIVKINDSTNEIDMAWKITQVRSYSIFHQDFSTQQSALISRKAGLLNGANRMILSLDFGHYFPHFLQIVNRDKRGKGRIAAKGTKGVLDVVDDDSQACQLIYVQLHSYVQEFSSRLHIERERMHKRLGALGLRENEIVGDGNCQMRAIADQLWRSQNKHEKVRQAIVSWLRSNPGYAIMEEGTGTVIATLSDFLQTDYHPTWESYCRYMGTNASWGDHITLLAAAEVYSMNVWVLSSVNTHNDHSGTEGQPWLIIKPRLNKAKRTIFLAHLHERHYTSLAY